MIGSSSNLIYRLAYGNGRFVGVTLSPPHSGVLTSVDGVNWDRGQFAGDGYYVGVQFGGGVFAAWDWSTLTIQTSTDRYRWVDHALSVPRRFASDEDGVASFHYIGFGLNSFIAIGAYGTIFQSDPLSDSPPQVLRGPSDSTNVLGSGVIFDFVGWGSSPLIIQWMKDGQPLPNATNALLVLSEIQALDSGDYRVRVRNSFGTAESFAAHLTVREVGPPVEVNYRWIVTFNATAGFRYLVSYRDHSLEPARRLWDYTALTNGLVRYIDRSYSLRFRDYEISAQRVADSGGPIAEPGLAAAQLVVLTLSAQPGDVVSVERSETYNLFNSLPWLQFPFTSLEPVDFVDEDSLRGAGGAGGSARFYRVSAETP